MKSTIILIIAAITFSSAQKKNIDQLKSSQPNGMPPGTLLNINRISAWYEANGKMEQNPFTGNSGATYPRSTATAIFSAGILWGGYVSDGQSSGTTPRVNGQSYNTGTQPGAILGTRTGVTEDPTNSDVRIFRIRRDYATADLKQDAAEFNSIQSDSVKTYHIDSLRAQYKRDWIEWPAAKGAPFYDADGDKKYSPKFEIKDGKEVPVLYPSADEPGTAEADQVIWYVANDIRGGDSPWKAKPIGLEEQVTLWGYNYPSNHGLGNSIFKRIRLIYKGTATTPDTAKMTEFYIGHWSDPDLGDAGDDFVGCDSVLGVGYVYNSRTPDIEYQKFNLAPPAVGYILLQGPLIKGNENDYAKYNFGWKKGFKNLPMTSFTYRSSGGSECFGLICTFFIYQELRGLPTTPLAPPDPEPLKNPVTNKPTRFWVDGDPVTHSGWVDGIIDIPSDRRMLMSSGPFTMSVGDTQEVVYALVGGAGSDRLASISVMKFFMKQSREYFNYLFPDDPTSVQKENEQLPNQFLLSQNYPNPFNPGTTITFTLATSLSQRVRVTLRIFDALGREIATLVNEEKESGTYTVHWNTTNFSSGVYFYRLTAGAFVETKKMILQK